MPWGSSRAGDGSCQAGMWSLVPCQRRLGSAGIPTPVAGPAADRTGRTRGVALSTHAAVEFTRFLPLAATRRAKATFLPAASAPCPGGGFAHGDAALGGHEAPSRHGPIPAEPALPIVPKISDSSVSRPAAGAELLCSGAIPGVWQGQPPPPRLTGVSVPFRGGRNWLLLLLL